MIGLDTRVARRGALAAFAALGAAALAGCNTLMTPAAEPKVRIPPDLKIASVTIDTSALPPQSGEAAASYVQSILPGLVARALESRMAPGDPNGATLKVEISSVVLGTVGAAGAIDRMTGVATLSAADMEPASATINATSAYDAPPGGQAIAPQATQARIQTLAQIFSDWLPRKLGL